MRYIYIFILLTCGVLYADEMQRLDTMVKEIETLRINYESSQEALSTCKEQLRAMSEIIVKKHDNSNKNELIILKNKIKDLEKKLYQKETEIAALQAQKKVKTKEKVCEKPKIKTNNFPKLKIREIRHTKAYAYRINTDRAEIYNALGGEVVQKWEKRRSFTSHIISADKEWVKITGYFVEGVWQPAQKELWVRSKDVLKRVK